jgi:hypothetical protein
VAFAKKTSSSKLFPRIRVVIIFSIIFTCWLTTARAAEPSKAPVYERKDWLEDSLKQIDLVVLGSPQKDDPAKPVMKIEKVLWGAAHQPLLYKDNLLLYGPRFEWGRAGVWLLLRTPRGYFNINPTFAPLAKDEWLGLAKRAPAFPDPNAPKLTEHERGHQLYRSDSKGVWHGNNVFLQSETFAELHVNGHKLLQRAWDSKGRLERVNHNPKKGPGFFIQWRAGKLWNFSYSLDQERHGLDRDYYRSGKLRSEKNYKTGFRHGWTRSWDEKGKLEYQEKYEDGFLPPVTRYRGKEKSQASLHKYDNQVSYGAPRKLMHAFKIGMTTAQVSKILKLDFSERSSIWFPDLTCDMGLSIEFKNGRISNIDHKWNGSCCDVVE